MAEKSSLDEALARIVGSPGITERTPAAPAFQAAASPQTAVRLGGVPPPEVPAPRYDLGPTQAEIDAITARTNSLLASMKPTAAPVSTVAPEPVAPTTPSYAPNFAPLSSLAAWNYNPETGYLRGSSGSGWIDIGPQNINPAVLGTLGSTMGAYEAAAGNPNVYAPEARAAYEGLVNPAARSMTGREFLAGRGLTGQQFRAMARPERQVLRQEYRTASAPLSYEEAAAKRATPAT